MGREVLVGSSSYLEEGMARLLWGSVYASYCWHSWRRAGAAFLRWKGLPWRHLCSWGRWASVRMAHWYAATPDEFVFHLVLRLPWPTSTGVRWKSVAVEDFWPQSLINLCAPDERPKRPSFTGNKRSQRDQDTPAEAMQARTSCKPWRWHAAPLTSGPSLPRPPFLLRASQGWGKSPPSAAHECVLVWSRTGGSRETHVGREVLVGSSSYLEEGMARLLWGSVYASYCWHSWRRAGAAFLRWKGLPWRHLCSWGRWASVRMAHWYAATPDEFVFHLVLRLPWPTSTGVRWKSVGVEDFWPQSLINLCAPDERPKRPSFTGNKRSQRDQDTPAEDSKGDACRTTTTSSG